MDDSGNSLPRTNNLDQMMLGNASIIIEVDDPQSVISLYLEGGKLGDSDVIQAAMEHGAEVFYREPDSRNAVRVSKEWYSPSDDSEDAPDPQYIGRIIVTSEVFELWTPFGTIFRVPLEVLAWQLTRLEPALGRYVVQPES